MTYELIEVEQGSEEWIKLRREKIGASDLAVIMGLHPWKTRYQLWNEKVNGIETTVNAAMQRGMDLEPVARKLFCDKHDIFVRPVVAVSKKRPWQMASLDGLSEDGRVVVEIKCGGRELYEKALLGDIPPYYVCQVQGEISVTEPQVTYYCCMYGNEIAVVEVKPDRPFIEDMLNKCEEFWTTHILKKEPPELSDRDYEVVEHTEGSSRLSRYFSLCAQKKEIEEEINKAKAELIEIGPGRNFILADSKIILTQTASYDTKAMKEDGINVDAYKKFSNPFWKILPPKKPSKAA